MGDAVAGPAYPPLTRHPDLQRIREAQNQMLIDPGFMSRLLGGLGQQGGAGFNTAGQQHPQGGLNFGSPGESHFRKQQPGEDWLSWHQQRMQFLRGGMGRNPQGMMQSGRPGGKG